VTAFYSFRMYFLVFHGNERYDQAPHDEHHADAHDDHGHDDHAAASAAHDDHGHHGGKPHETPWVVTLPLVLLAIPSVVIGFIAIEPMLYGGYFGNAIFISEHHHALHEMHEEFHGAFAMALHSLTTLPLWLAIAGVASAAFFYLKRPDIPALIQKKFQLIYTLLDNKYYFDRFNDWFFAGGARGASGILWKFGDVKLIDGLMVNGSAKLVGMFSNVVRRLQSGYIYHYAFSMIIGVFVLLTMRDWF
ncbi:MAG: NADH-quinone oxidoreductase subunit L, partial [Gallionella sp.]|nr:NADH-quinone oxidoreductase subunit L [Gallionella sp.]